MSELKSYVYSLWLFPHLKDEFEKAYAELDEIRINNNMSEEEFLKEFKGETNG